jgi:CheY-like chemotaxis protein
MDELPFLLLVEDEPLIRTSLAAALEDGGYALAEAGDAEEALAHLASEQTFVGVVTDIKLGSEMNGWEVARHARQAYPGIAVVYMSGDSAADWTAEGVPNSVMLQKPLPLPRLQRRSPPS